MASPRSTKLFAGHPPAVGSYQTLFTCPAGRVTLVKFFTVLHNAAAPQVSVLTHADAAGVELALWDTHTALAQNQQVAVDLGGVLEPGETLIFFPGAGVPVNWFIGLYGSELTL